MTSKTWFGGGNNNANNANDWSPYGAPQPGDTLDMQAGVMNIRGKDLAGDTLVIGKASTSTTETLNLSNHASATLDLAQFSTDKVTANISGLDALTVNTEFPNTVQLTVNIADYSTLIGGFHMVFASVAVNGGTGSRLVNNGTIGFVGTSSKIDTSVQGNGTIHASTAQSRAAEVEFGGSVSHGQNVEVFGDPGRRLLSHVQIDQPSEFKGSVALGAFGEVDLKGLSNADSYQIKQDMLSIYSGSHVIEALRLTNPSNPNLPAYVDSVFKTASGVSIARASLDGSYHGTGTLLPVHT